MGLPLFILTDVDIILFRTCPNLTSLTFIGDYRNESHDDQVVSFCHLVFRLFGLLVFFVSDNLFIWDNRNDQLLSFCLFFLSFSFGLGFFYWGSLQ